MNRHKIMSLAVFQKSYVQYDKPCVFREVNLRPFKYDCLGAKMHSILLKITVHNTIYQEYYSEPPQK